MKAYEGAEVLSEYIIFGAPQIERAEIDEVVAVLESGWLGTGPRVAQFEKDFAAYKGVSGAAAVNSCTAALHLALVASDLEPGDEVITTSLTFAATANAIIHAGATPVVVDVDPLTMNIAPEAIRSAITSRTKALVPVHFAGRPCEMSEIGQLADQHDLKLIEDCAHAIESQYQGKPIGTFGDFGCFSFYVTKNVVTGEGGMLIAKNENLLSRIKTLALHGLSKDAWKRFSDTGYVHYDVVECGFKYNMMDIQAAIGLHQLRRVEQSWLRRQEIWDYYNRELSDLPVTLPAAPASDTRHALHLYTLLIEGDRDAFLRQMHEAGIGCGVHYRSLTEHPYYQERFGWRPDDTPHATSIGRRTASIPLSARLTDAEVERVVAAVRRALG